MDEKQFRMDFDAFLRSFKQSKNGSFAFLLGAGAPLHQVSNLRKIVFGIGKNLYM